MRSASRATSTRKRRDGRPCQLGPLGDRRAAARRRSRARVSIRSTSAAGTSWPRSREMRDAPELDVSAAAAATGRRRRAEPRGRPAPIACEERRGAGDAERRRADVAAAFEADRRLGLEPEPLARAPDRRRVKVGALEHDAARRGANFRVVAAHDAAHRAGAIAVGNHEHVGIERAVRAVERPDALARTGAPDDDLPARQPRVDRRHASAGRARASRSW